MLHNVGMVLLRGIPSGDSISMISVINAIGNEDIESISPDRIAYAAQSVSHICGFHLLVYVYTLYNEYRADDDDARSSISVATLAALVFKPLVLALALVSLLFREQCPQQPATWGIDRIDQTATTLDDTFTTPGCNMGEGEV